MSKLSLFAATMLCAALHSASADILISQYYEGTSNNKYIELHNPTSEPIEMAGYRLTLWTNAARENWKTDGAVPSQNFDLSGVTLPAGGYYLLAHSSAAIPAYAIAGANVRNSNIINFNGDDSVVLYNSSTYNTANILDAVSISAALQGQDKSFYRITNEVGYSTVAGANITEFPLVWAVKTLDEVLNATAADLWYLTAQAAATPPVLDTFTLAGDAAATVVPGVVLNFTLSGASATDFMASEDAAFTGAVWQQYTTQPKFTLSSGAGAKTVYFKLKNAGGESAVLSDTIELTSYTYPGTVVFSQYYEGLANDKHVEIANLSAAPVDLAAWNLVRWTNQDAENWKYSGSSATGSSPSQVISLGFVNTDGVGSTILAPGAVIVISHNQASGPSARAAAALVSSLLSHNGNDSIALYSGAVGPETLMDVLSFTELGNEGFDVSFVRSKAEAGFGFAAGSKITDFPAVWQSVALTAADAAIPGQGAHLGTYPDGNLPPGGYDAWAAAYPGIGAPDVDADADGSSNLLEYATGSVPDNAASVPEFLLTRIGPTLTVTWAKGALAAADSSLQYSVEASVTMDAGSWSADGVVNLQNLPSSISADYVIAEGTPKVFLRLKIVRTPG